MVLEASRKDLRGGGAGVNVASLALSGHDAEARETLRRYLALPLDVPKTIAQFKARQPDDTPNLRSYYEKGLRKAGLPEE